MTQTLGEFNTIPDQFYKPSKQVKSARITENTAEEHDGLVYAYSCGVDRTKTSPSSEKYLNSDAETKRQGCCHSGETRAGKSVLISSGFNLKEKTRSCECITKAKYLHICLLVSVGVTIGLILTVVFLGTKVAKNAGLKRENYPLQHLPKEHLEDILCIPCDYCQSTVKAEDTLFDTVSLYGSKFCCVKNGSLQKLFLLMLQEGYTRKATNEQVDSGNFSESNTTLSTWTSRNIAAHVYANVASLPEKLTWQTDAGYGTAFTNGIALTNESRLKVPRAGFYFIYSLVTFKCLTESSTALIHLINREHKGRPVVGVQQLLMSKTSKCGHAGIHTSFLAGVLKLTANDELSVNLTDYALTFVYKATISNYFGLYLI